MIARRTTTVLLAVAQLTTAVYLVVYLARWQWNRALICGVLLLATEVLIVGRLIIRRLRAIEERLAGMSAAERVQLRVVQHRPEPTDRFAWMRDATTRTNVFLPVLLGAGVLASVVAWVVEAVARRTARPTMERSLVAALAPLSFPAGGFFDEAPPGPTAVAPRRRWGRRGALAAAAVAVVLAVGLVVDVLADAIQTRPDRLDAGVSTVVDLRFRGERALSDLERHAGDLVQLCASQSFRREVGTVGLAPVAPDAVRVVLDGDLGRNGTARFRGCLEDVTLDEIQASVATIAEVRAVTP